MPPRVSKRKRPVPSFGAPSDADSPLAQRDVPSSAASSIRRVPETNIPPLTTLCTRKFAANFVNLRNNESLWERLAPQLQSIPDIFIPKIFSRLRSSCPTYLDHGFIATYLLKGPSITLTNSLPGVGKKTISAIPRFNNSLRELELSGFGKGYADKTFASALRNLTKLRVLILRDCTNVGAETIAAIADSCNDLQVVNLNYTSTTPGSLAQLVKSCSSLESLKVAGIQNWTDATFTNFLHSMDQETKLTNLRALKIKQTQLGDVSIHALMNLCPNLQRFDASFTLLKRSASLLSLSHTQPLEKLCLSCTSISPTDLSQILPRFPRLRVLSLGALGISRGSQASITNTSAMTMDDTGLGTISRVLANFTQLERVSLVGNTKLGTTTKPGPVLADFIYCVGRKLKNLNLAGIPRLQSVDLAGLLSRNEEEDMPRLETLILNNTGIDDEAGAYISACSRLTELGVAGTRITSDGLLPILDACPKLQSLDLTSCRGIKVAERRRFFEVWQEQSSEEEAASTQGYESLSVFCGDGIARILPVHGYRANKRNTQFVTTSTVLVADAVEISTSSLTCVKFPKAAAIWLTPFLSR